MDVCLIHSSFRFSGKLTTDQAEIFVGNHLLELPKAGSFVAMELTAILSPSRFYVIMPYGPRPLGEILREGSISYDGIVDFECSTSLHPSTGIFMICFLFYWFLLSSDDYNSSAVPSPLSTLNKQLKWAYSQISFHLNGDACLLPVHFIC